MGGRAGPPRPGRRALHIGLEHAVHVFVLLHGHVQGAQEPLGGEVIHHQPVRQLHRLAGDRDICVFKPKSSTSSSGVPVTRQKLA